MKKIHQLKSLRLVRNANHQLQSWKLYYQHRHLLLEAVFSQPTLATLAAAVVETVFSQPTLATPPAAVVDAVFEPTRVLPVPPKEVVDAAIVTVPPPEFDSEGEEPEPRTKKEVVGYTLDDLYNRFKLLWSRCVGNKDIASKSELTCLIEELFDHDAMSDSANLTANQT